jgi:hypothetical protein
MNLLRVSRSPLEYRSLTTEEKGKSSIIRLSLVRASVLLANYNYPASYVRIKKGCTLKLTPTAS